MAHNLAQTNGQIAMAFYGDPPWHKLGTKLDSPATAAEAIVAAGLDYDIQLGPLFTADGSPVPNRKGVIRADTNQVIGSVGKSYIPIQNREAFSFMDAVVADDGLRFHTAGALGLGEKIWLLAKLPKTIQIKSSVDITEQFLLLHNSHDGSACLRVYYTPVRVVCNNTLTFAEQKAQGQGIAIRHKGNLESKIGEAQKVLGLATKFYDDLELKINHLANYYPTLPQLDQFFKSLYPDPLDGNKTRAENVRSELFRLFENGIGQQIPAIRHTWWAAYHAATEYVDHKRSCRGQNEWERLNKRLHSIWFGSGSRLKTRAWELALALSN